MPAPANYASRADVKWEVAMPVYEYVCKDCHKEFEQVLTLTEHDAGKIVCPKCGSKNVEQEAAGFFAVTSKKS
jgi:putative FmdB family regulatory protein